MFGAIINLESCGQYKLFHWTHGHVEIIMEERNQQLIKNLITQV